MSMRLVWVDWAKAILIYLMVVGHCFPVSWENKLIYAFHMPAFFIISGYLYRPHHWLKTLKAFLIPIAFYSCVNLIIYAVPKLITGAFVADNLVMRVLLPFWGGNYVIPDNQVIYCFPGVWFIISLLLCRLLMGDIQWFSWVTKHKYIVLGVLLVYLAVEPFILPNNPLLAYKFYRFVPSMPFCLVGFCLKDSFDIKKIPIPLAGVLCILFITITYLNGYTNILNYQFGVSYIVFYVNAIIGSLVLFKVCSLFKSSPVVIVLSMGTMLILALNFNLKVFFNVSFSKLGLETLINDQYLYPWIVGALIMFVCVFPIKWLLGNYPLLLGK